MKKLPITVGVIGHIDAMITPEHLRIVEELFYDIHEAFPHSPLVLFSQLARGADTEIAEIFLEIKEKTGRDYQLVVPLPFEVEEFRKTFEGEGLTTFDRLYANADRTFVLESDSGALKDDLYRKGGQFVADSSMILIAIWNKEDNRKKGGTADIVKYKIEGSFDDEIAEHIFDKEGSLISLDCNRLEAGVKRKINLHDRVLEILFAKDKSIKETLDRVEVFNKNTQSFDEKAIAKSATDLYPDEEVLIPSNERLRSYFAAIDVLAGNYRQWYVLQVFGLILSGFIFIIVFEVYKQYGQNQTVFFMIVMLLVLSLVGFTLSKRWKIHERYLENRVLAEALRIQFYWNLSNVREAASNYILRIHKMEYRWIKHILLAIHGVTYDDNQYGADTIANVKEYWIDHQKQYFIKKGKLLKKKGRINHIVSTVLGGASVVLLFMIYFINRNFDEPGLVLFMMVFFTILIAAFALIQAYFEKRGYRQISNQYALMETIYSGTKAKIDATIADEKLSEEDKKQQIHDVLKLAGKEALSENGNWYMIFKDKKPEAEGFIR